MSTQTIEVEDRQAATLPKLTYTMLEVSKMLGISYATTQKLVQAGHLHPIAPFRMRLFTRAEVDRFLARSSRCGSPNSRCRPNVARDR